MTNNNTAILVVLMDNPQHTYDRFRQHPDVPIESTSILHTMEDDKYEWNQRWIDLYWAEADMMFAMWERELTQNVGEKWKAVRDAGVGLENKKPKVSGSLTIVHD